MSLIRSRAKILGQISRPDITITRSSSAQSQRTGSRLNHSVAELSGVKNVGEIPDREVQKPQITLSRSLFSLFKKKGSNAQNNVTNNCSEERRDESWLSKMLTKPPKTMTPQERCMMKTREMQRKQEVGLVQIPYHNWKPSVMIVTTENSVPKSNLPRSPAPPPTLQPVPPPSVETRLMELHEKHNTCALRSEMEMDMHKYIPKLPYSEFKPQKKETPAQFCMEKYEDKRTAASEVGDRRKSVSAHGHRRTDRKFSWYTQQSLERSEPGLANIHSNTALIHTGRKNIQYFTHRNYMEPQRPRKLKGHSLQTQISKRKYILTHAQIKDTPSVLPIGSNEVKPDQFSPNLILDTKPNTSELPSLHFTAKSLTQIPKISIDSCKEAGIKHTNVISKIPPVLKKLNKINMQRNIGEARQCIKSIKSKEKVTLKGISYKNESTVFTNQKLNVQNQEASHDKRKSSITYNSIGIPQCSLADSLSSTTKKNSQLNNHNKEIPDSHNVKVSNRLEKGQSHKVLYKLELRRWMKRVKEKERSLGNDKTEIKTLQNLPGSEFEQITSQNEVKHNNEKISKVSSQLFHQTLETSNQKCLSKMQKPLEENQIKLDQPIVMEVSKPSSEVHAFPSTSNLCTILSLSKKPLWENVISYTEAKANAEVSLGKKRDYHEYSVSQTEIQLANSLETLQKLLSSHVKSESLNKLGIKSKLNIKDAMTIQGQLRNGPHISRTEAANVKQNLNTNNLESTLSEKSQENHNKQVIDTKINEQKSINESDSISDRKCEHVQQKSTTESNSSKEVLLQRENQRSPQRNETSITGIYHQLTHDLRYIPSIQERKRCNITDLVNRSVTKYDSEGKHDFPLKNNNSTFDVYSHETKAQSTEMLGSACDTLPKTEILVSDVMHGCLENIQEKKNKSQKSSDIVGCVFTEGKEQAKHQTIQSNENLHAINSKENNIGLFGDKETYTNGRKSRENITPKVESHFANPLDTKRLQTEWLRSNNFVQNCSSQIYSQPKFIYETIQAKSCNGLIPVTTYNSMLNKNWTFADFAAYFYGAMFGKQDLLNMQIHKLLGTNNKECNSSLLENAITNISNTMINELQSDQILTPSKIECTSEQEKTKNKPEISNVGREDEELANKTSIISAVSANNINDTTTNPDTISKCNSENKHDFTNNEDVEHSSQNTSNTVKSPSSSNSCTTAIQCCPTKRNYSSWSIREPFNPNQSSFECKTRKTKKDPHKKGKKPKKGEAKQLVCEEKVPEAAIKRLHLPGCKLPSVSGCSDDRIESLPCIKKEAPAPSFSECLRYPIKKSKFTECDCHKKTYPKCKTGYVLPKNYDACRKKRVKHQPKKEKEEELDDVDEGQLPPCDK